MHGNRKLACHFFIPFSLLSFSGHRLVYDALHHIFAELAAGVAEYISVAVNHKGRREGEDSVRVKYLSRRIHHDRIRIAVILQEFFNALIGLLASHIRGRYSQDDQRIVAFRIIGIIQLLDIRHLGAARRAPGCPEVQEDRFPFVIGQRMSIAILIL